MINIREEILRIPFLKKQPKLIRNLILNMAEKIIRLNEINSFLINHKDSIGISFIDELFEYLNFSFVISQKDLEKIPSEGRLIIFANHPLGALDALAVIKAVSNVRSDVKIIANEIMMQIPNLRNVLLPYNLYSSGIQRENIKNIGKALENEEAIIIFPAAEVSRLKFYKIKDKKWNKGVIYFSGKHQVPVLPVYINVRNSILFYLISGLSKSLSSLLLPGEMFNKKNTNISLIIGEQIPIRALNSLFIDEKEKVKLLRKHLFAIAKKKKGIFKTEKNIIAPLSRKQLKKELLPAKILGVTSDGKKILLTDFEKSPNVIKEIARLREVTFRKVGEGTGAKLDMDEFDFFYKHLVLWDDEELDIVGAYRLGICNEILLAQGIQGLYTSTLFDFSEEFINNYLRGSIELGRSFIQKKYWNSNALENLWQGIGAYIYNNPDTKFMFGPVSISNNFPDEVKSMLVYFYTKWFHGNEAHATAKSKFIISPKSFSECSTVLDSYSIKEDYKKLKAYLKIYGFSIPPLYKHYSDLCEPGGVNFWDFGVDKDFGSCIDGFITAEVAKLKQSKKERYVLRCEVNNEV